MKETPYLPPDYRARLERTEPACRRVYNWMCNGCRFDCCAWTDSDLALHVDPTNRPSYYDLSNTPASRGAE